ncbi:zeta toxin family protein [Aliiruegeria lutimaris]|uniref:Predicted kinase n=1 Tax=Aliiruegeria lutimaris TaxID=571298 RepID=A0A1G9AZ25_9RHOB|nr:zeta toxin family protein [Aliiruegeria lutimaris]SDK32114.1 Predicted kinase [Aliiruegeria lutimaris]
MPEGTETFIATLARRYRVIDEGWATTPQGYFDQKLVVVFDDGTLGEFQFWPPGMLEAKGKRGGHKLYEIARGPASTPEQVADAEAKMIALYGEVEDAKSLAWRELDLEPEPLQPGGREATLLLGSPAAGKSTIANEIAVARGAAILDSDEIKKTIPEFDGGIGAGAVHEESSDLAKLVEAELLAGGYNVVIPKVGGSAASIEKLAGRLRAAGYEIRLVNMAVTSENAYKRMIGRYVSSGRIIPPAYVDAIGDKPSSVFRELKEKGLFDGYAEIDNNGGKHDAKPVSELEGVNPLEGSRFDPGREVDADLSPGGRERGQGNDPVAQENSGEASGGARAENALTEETGAGEQVLMAGVAPVTLRDRLEAQADARTPCPSLSVFCQLPLQKGAYWGHLHTPFGVHSPF